MTAKIATQHEVTVTGLTHMEMLELAAELRLRFLEGDPEHDHHVTWGCPATGRCDDGHG